MIFPVMTLRMTQAIMPNIMPEAMELVKGIIMTAKKPPTLSAISLSKFIFLRFFAISRPTKMRAGAVANEGIARNRG